MSTSENKRFQGEPQILIQLALSVLLWLAAASTFLQATAFAPELPPCRHNIVLISWVPGGHPGPKTSKIKFSVPRAPQPLQDHLHFDLVPAPSNLRLDFSSRLLLFFPVQELLRFSSIAVFRKLAIWKLAGSRTSWINLGRCALKS